MIPSLSVDTQSFKEIYEKMRHIAGLSGKTEMEYQDPGETLLELFALLFDMQRFYMDQVTNEHRLKYAKLLGLSEQKMEYAQTLMQIHPGNEKENLTLPEYTLLGLKDLPFETTEEVKVSYNAIQTFRQEGNNEWRIGFEYNLYDKPVYRIYLEADALPEPLEYPVAKWECEYLSDNGGWKPAGNYEGKGFLPVSITANDMKKDEGLYWLKIILKGDHIEVMPKLLSVKINIVKAQQAKTVILDDDADDYTFKTEGMPNQRIPLDILNLDENSVRLEIASEDKDREEWERVSDFYTSGPKDAHFIVKDGYICFGNHERGRIPPLGKCKLTHYTVSLGSRGNVQKGAIKTNFVENITAATGGRDRQSDPLAGFSEERNKMQRAVTAEDYENLLREMPVLKLEQIRAVVTEDTAIRIYIKPKSDRDCPELNETYRKNILHYLKRYRIITTRLEIVSAEYYMFSIKLIADFGAQQEEGKKMVETVLAEHFPYPGFTYQGTNKNPKRAFGEKITYGDFFRIISAVPQVRTIESLKLFSIGKEDNEKEIFSSMQLKPGELAYLKKIEIGAKRGD